MENECMQALRMKRKIEKFCHFIAPYSHLIDYFRSNERHHHDTDYSSEDDSEPSVDESIDEDPKSDLSIDHHPKRVADYALVEETDNDTYEDDTESIESGFWVVNDVNIHAKCFEHAEACFSKKNQHQLSDISIL